MHLDDYLKEILVITKNHNLYDISNIQINQRKDITQKISYLLTNTSLLSETLQNTFFEKGYNFKKELSILLTNFYNTYKNEIKIANIHYLYTKYLDRCCDYNSLKYFIDDPNYNQTLLQLTLQRSIEKECVDWKNSNCSTIKLVNYYYITLLNYIPNEVDLKFLFTLKDQINFKSYLLNYIQSKNDYIYIEQCRFHFNNLSNTIPYNNGGIKIKYYGAVGTSGYANITKNIIESLVNDNRFDIYFKVLQFQNYDAFGKGNELLSSLSKKNTILYDYIIIHSTPEYFPIISQIEREINPNVIIYSITVWETEKLPHMWEYYSKFVDKISVPSKFSSIAFKGNCDIIHHPIFIKNEITEIKCCLFDIKHKYSYIFYNISEWTNRKGIDDLIDVFLDLYGKNSKILLYLKTFGDISKEEGYKYILDLCKIKKIIFLENIILDYNRVSSSYINCIHSCADCYVSFTRSEGQGLGLCYSALNGNQTIVTNYSGHLDYLKEFKNIYYINYKLIPATFCSTWSSKHKKCRLLPYCSFFDKFTPSNQSWAQIDKLHAKEIMLKVSKFSRIKHKQNKNIFTSEKFCNDLYNSLIITTCNRKDKYNFKKVIGKTLNYFPQMMYIDWKIKKKLIGILNCSIYGNVGDFSYSYIIEKYLTRSEYELTFIDDQHGDIKQDIIPIDYLIIGGGGLLNLERLNQTNKIWEYQHYCIINKIPYYLLSLGFQDTDLNGKNIDKLKNYAYLLDNSNFISVRSFPDYMIACNIIKNETKEFLHIYSDLVYSLPLFIPYKEFKRDILLVVLDNNWITLDNEYIRNDINQRLFLNKNLKLVFTDFAGIAINNKSNIDVKLINKYFPNSLIINGIMTVYSHIRNSTLSDIIEILCKSHTVISGRLHSYILSKVYKVPNIENYNYSNYKVFADKFSNLDNNCAITPLKLIDYYINHDIIFTSKDWSENDRNDSIVRLHQKTNIAIEHIQNWNNRQIEEKLFSLN